MVSMKDLMDVAYHHNFAVPAVNVENLDMIEGVMIGAKEANSPIILQATEPTVKSIDPAYLVYIIKFLQKKYDVIAMLHLDHASDPSLIMKCIREGFNSVMLDYSNFSLQDNITQCKQVISMIHDLTIAVELEIGAVGDKKNSSIKTSIRDAQIMSDAIKCDMLAISIGNSHGGLLKQSPLDLKLLQELDKALNCPLVLHGSSGVINDYITKSTEYGICKVNIETEYRQAFRQILTPYFADSNIIKPREVREKLISSIAEKTVEKCKITKSLNTLQFLGV